MTFPTPPTALALQQSALRISTETVPQSVELRKILEVGKVLNVTVQEDRAKGELELELLGKRIPASLPPNAQAGQRLQVQVVDNSDAIILKIVSSGTDGLQAQPSVELDTFLKSLLSQETLKSLKLSSFPLASLIPDTIAKYLDGNTKASGSNDGLARIFESLISGKQLVSQETLENPEALRQVLLKVGQREVLNTLQQATDALRRLSKDSLSPEHTEFLKALDSAIQHLLQDTSTLEFYDAPESPHAGGLPPGLSNALTPRVASGMPAKTQQNSPISTLLKTLLSFSLPDTPGSAIENDFARFVQQMTSELSTLREKGAADPQLREALVRASKTLHEKFGKTLISPEPKALAETVRTLKLLESVSQSQEVLNQLNPLVQAFGEPALILIPSILHGLLSKWEVSVRKPYIDPEDDESSKKDKVRPLERISLYLPFPNLGEVQVELAHRKGELLLSLTCSNPEVAKFLSSKLPGLEKTFTDRGYAKTLLTALKGEPKGSLPGWYSDMVKRSTVA